MSYRPGDVIRIREQDLLLELTGQVATLLEHTDLGEDVWKITAIATSKMVFDFCSSWYFEPYGSPELIDMFKEYLIQ